MRWMWLLREYIQGRGEVTRVYINQDAFRYIEKRGARGVTAAQLAKKIGIKKRSAATWLSKWASQGYLKHGQGTWREAGIYVIDGTCKWWGEKVFDSERKSS